MVTVTQSARATYMSIIYTVTPLIAIMHNFNHHGGAVFTTVALQEAGPP